MNNQTPDANGLPPRQGQGDSLLAAAEGITGLLYSPAAKPPFLRKPPRPPPKGEPDRRPGRGGPAPADEAPGRTTAPGRSAGRANRRAARTAQGTTEEGPPAQTSGDAGAARRKATAEPTPNSTKRLSFVGLVPFQPNKNFRFVGYRATALPAQTNFRKKFGKVEMLGRKNGGVLRHPPKG